MFFVLSLYYWHKWKCLFENICQIPQWDEQVGREVTEHENHHYYLFISIFT